MCWPHPHGASSDCVRCCRSVEELVRTINVGLIASERNLRSALAYVPAALFGALVGAFAAFGDASFLLRHPFVRIARPGLP